MKIGLQIYSIRDALGLDYLGTLQKVKQMGFAGVELFGDHYSGLETNAMLEQTGLEVIGHHFMFDQLHNDFAACAERVKAIGTDFLVCAWSMPSTTTSWLDILSGLSVIAQKCKDAGLRFAYHNHEHEVLQQINQSSVLEHILALVNAEVDVAWIHAGGLNPAVFLEQNAQKVQALHFKDVKLVQDAWQTVELGQGSVPLKEILNAAASTPSEWLIIEQDHSTDPMGSAERNLAWLKAALE
jgi:sugar phosphate isomerase/epimerase